MKNGLRLAYSAIPIAFYLAASSNAGAAETANYRTIHDAYMARDGQRYTQLVSSEIVRVRGLSPRFCAQEQQQLISTAGRSGLDGLEPVWLLLQDCASRSADREVTQQVLDNAQRFIHSAGFRASPAAQIEMRVGRYNGLVVRSIRGAAVRAVVEQAQRQDAATLAGWRLDQLLGRTDVHHALCGLGIRQDQYGRAALPDLIVRALCEHADTLGRFGSVDAMCDALLNPPQPGELAAAAEIAAGPLADRLQQAPDVGAAEVDRLSDFCNRRVGGSGFGGGSMDALNGFGGEGCFGGRGEEIAEMGRIIGLIEDCLETSGSDNPLADGAGGTQNDSQTAADEPEISTVENPDGSTTEIQKFSDGKVVRVTSHKDGATTTEVQYPNGDRELITMDGDGNIEYGETRKTESDGTVVEREIGPNGEIVNETRTQVQDSGEVTSVMREANGGFYQTIVPKGMLDEANDRIDKQIANDQGGPGYIINLWTKRPGSSSPGGDGLDGFDPSNPACFELSNLGFFDGQGGYLGADDLWDYLFGRQPGEPHPSTVYPTPDTIDDVNQEQLCGEFGGGSFGGSRCQSLVLCVEGSQLDENCQCQPTYGAPRGLMGSSCASYLCADGTEPVPNGLNGCECRSGSEGELPPPPPPGPGPDPMTDSVVRMDGVLSAQGIAAGRQPAGDHAQAVVPGDGPPLP